MALDDLLAVARKARGNLMVAEESYKLAKERYDTALREWQAAVSAYEAEDMRLALEDGRTKKIPRGMRVSPTLTVEQLLRLAKQFGIELPDEEEELENDERDDDLQTSEEG